MRSAVDPADEDCDGREVGKLFPHVVFVEDQNGAPDDQVESKAAAAVEGDSGPAKQCE